MSEYEQALRLAHAVQDRIEPDTDLAILAKQFLHVVERLDTVLRVMVGVQA